MPLEIQLTAGVGFVRHVAVSSIVRSVDWYGSDIRHEGQYSCWPRSTWYGGTCRFLGPMFTSSCKSRTTSHLSSRYFFRADQSLQVSLHSPVWILCWHVRHLHWFLILLALMFLSPCHLSLFIRCPNLRAIFRRAIFSSDFTPHRCSEHQYKK